MSTPPLSFRDRVVSTCVWTYLLTATTVFSLFVLATFPLVALVDLKRRRFLTGVMRTWCRLLIWGCPLWSARVEGQENAAPGQTYIICSTHQSYGDIFVMGVVPVPFVFMSKAEIFKIPLVGWGMYLVGCVSVKRGNKQSARAVMGASARKLRDGVSLCIFPEGTRSADGNLGPFKEGAFRLAVQTGCPILPVAIEGSRFILPKGRFSFYQRARVRVALLPPISAEGLTEADVPALLEKTRAALAAKLAELRALGENPAEPR